MTPHFGTPWNAMALTVLPKRYTGHGVHVRPCPGVSGQVRSRSHRTWNKLSHVRAKVWLFRHSSATPMLFMSGYVRLCPVPCPVSQSVVTPDMKNFPLLRGVPCPVAMPPCPGGFWVPVAGTLHRGAQTPESQSLQKINQGIQNDF